jgi:hypothetical protein
MQRALLMIEKPAYGSPCNGCGGCCRHGICTLGSKIFSTRLGPCPALESQADGRERCGLIENPGKYRSSVVRKHGPTIAGQSAAVLVGSGAGCDARLEDETVPEEVRQRVRTPIASKAVIEQARRVWGV